jgi:hypothetical protein
LIDFVVGCDGRFGARSRFRGSTSQNAADSAIMHGRASCFRQKGEGYDEDTLGDEFACSRRNYQQTD